MLGLSFLFRHDLGIAGLLDWNFLTCVARPSISHHLLRLIAVVNGERPLETIENTMGMHKLIVVAFLHVIQMGHCCGCSVAHMLLLLNFSVGTHLIGGINILRLFHSVDWLSARQRAGMPRVDPRE